MGGGQRIANSTTDAAQKKPPNCRYLRAPTSTPLEAPAPIEDALAARRRPVVTVTAFGGCRPKGHGIWPGWKAATPTV